MSDLTRRDWLKTVGVVSAGALVPIDPTGAEAIAPAHTTAASATAPVFAPGDIVELTSTSEIFMPPRGRSYMKFSFDFPEPSVVVRRLSLRLPRLHRREHVRPRPLEDARRGQRRRDAS